MLAGLRAGAVGAGGAVGVCWGLAVLLGTARGCWGLPGVPGMRWLIEFAGDCWGLLVVAQTPVSPPLALPECASCDGELEAPSGVRGSRASYGQRPRAHIHGGAGATRSVKIYI